LEPKEFQAVSILVDSGSQQAPLCSTAVAQRLGATGKLSSFALQAGGQPLPIYNVGWCDLGINGRSCRTQFKSAALSPFDIILGESWLREHRGVLDYANNRLWQKDLQGNLRPLTFDLPGLAIRCVAHHRSSSNVGTQTCADNRDAANFSWSFGAHCRLLTCLHTCGF
jgi:hypothetical protein